MDDDKLRRDEHASVMRSRNLFLGVTLIVVGVLWMMNNLELLSDSLFDVVFSWQMLLVLIGGFWRCASGSRAVSWRPSGYACC